MAADATQDDQHEEAPQIVHDEIVRRLLQYQAQLREGIKAGETEPAAPAASLDLIDYSALETPAPAQVDEVVDIAAAESASEIGLVVTIPEPGGAAAEPLSGARGDLDARVARLESAIEQIASSLADLRIQAQDSAMLIDDRLAEVLEKLGGTVPPPADEIPS
jgi:hypothetical protein